MKIPITLTAATIAGVGVFGWTVAAYRPSPAPALGRAGLAESPNRWAPGTGRRPTTAELRAQLASNPDDAETWRRLGWSLKREGDEPGAQACWVMAADLKARASGANPTGADLYDLARFRALAGDREGALAAWERCIEAGWADYERAARSRDLNSIRDDPRFIEGFERIAPSPGDRVQLKVG